MEFWNNFLNADFLAFVAKVGGPFVVIGGILGYIAWRMANKVDELNKHIEELQEKRIAENKAMQTEYSELARDMDKTLELLIKMVNNGKRGGKGE
jgi:hypothetical protein